MDQYSTSIVGLLALSLVSLLLAVYSGMAKGQAKVLAGPVADARDDNPLYRIDRVHMNSVEALAPFAVPAILAMLAGVGPALLGILVWLHLAIRLAHLVVYLRGGTPATGGSLRTLLYVASGLVTIVLVLVTAWSALT